MYGPIYRRAPFDFVFLFIVFVMFHLKIDLITIAYYRKVYNMVHTYLKAYLQKKPIGKERTLGWVISTSKSRPVSLFGEEASTTASFSEWDGTPKVKGLTRSVFLNCTDEMASQYEQLAGGRTFYFAIPQDEDSPMVVLTPVQYKEQHAKENASDSTQEPEQIFAD